MSARKLGGGRVLGSGKTPSPSVAISSKGNLSLLSPTTSSISLSSSASTTPLSTEAQDLSSRISLDQNDGISAAAAAASSRLMCPICNEDMVNVLPTFISL